MLDDLRDRIRYLRSLPEDQRDGYISMADAFYWLTPEEVAELRRALYDTLQVYRDRRLPTGDGRRRIAVSYSVLPERDA